MVILKGDALDLIEQWDTPIDLLATDPPYAFSGSGAEHAISATVATVLREAAKKVRRGGWAVVFAASSWRSTAYMVESLRGVMEPVRIASWCKPDCTSKTRTPGWKWASVNVIAFRKGKSAAINPSCLPDFIVSPPKRNGRRAELPNDVAEWAVSPFCIPGGIALDPFSGSGAIVKAATLAGMKAFGFEKGECSNG
jgi:DNA modification methylase